MFFTFLIITSPINLIVGPEYLLKDNPLNKEKVTFTCIYNIKDRNFR